MIKRLVFSTQDLRIKKYWNLLVLGPLFFYPFIYCPFRLPYLYCFICPVKCIWYRLRGIVFVAAVGLNIKNNLFCEHLCPGGAIQRLLFKIVPKRLLFRHCEEGEVRRSNLRCSKKRLLQSLRSFAMTELKHFAAVPKYISLALFIFLIAATKKTEILSYNFLGISLSRLMLVNLKVFLGVIFLFSIIMSIVTYRPFCRYFCPVAALSNLIIIITRRGVTNNGIR